MSATEEEVNVETPIKTEYGNSEMDVGDQNEGFEVDPEKEHDDWNMLKTISEAWNSSNEVTETNFKECADTLDLEVDLLDIVKEEPFADYGNSIEDTNQDSTSDSDDNMPLQSNSKQWKPDRLKNKSKVSLKRSNVSEIKISQSASLPKKRKPDIKTEKEILKSQAPIPNNEKTTTNINSDVKNSKIKANSSEQVTAPNNIFICDVCKKEYLCKSYLKKHIKTWHIIGFEQNYKNTNLLKGKDELKTNNVTENKPSKNKNQYKCSYCMKCFSLHDNLAKHVRIHTGEKPYKCSSCMKCFSQRGHLARHERFHTGEKLYKCRYCTKCFTSSSNLTTHVRIHTGEKPYKCSYCTKCFTTSSKLTTHVRIHTGEQPYKCSYCTKRFTQSSNLATHVRIHTGEKPYNCSYCTKCFSDNSVLTTHVRIHTGEKPYKCSYCTKCFTTSSKLITHVRIHAGERPYKCSYCTKCFSHSSALAKHVTIHTGEKPYKCSYCTKCFTKNSALATHVRVHTGEKPYNCSYCVKCFTTNSNLAKHVRRSHT